MELRVLNYFLVIAREENITKAARLLHITQPTLSRQIMQLEEELGVKLFYRSNHHIVLTEEGMLLKRRAQELLSLAEKTKKDFLRRDQNLTGEIMIGSGEFLGTKLFSEMMAAFQKKHPLVRYQIYSGNAVNIKDYIERGLLDLGVMGEPVDIRKYEFISMPVKEKWGVLVRADAELAKKEYVQVEDLIEMPMVIASRDLRSELGSWFGDAFDHLHIMAKGNLPYNEAMMVSSGIGIAICIQLHCAYEDLKFIPLYLAVETRTALVWKKDQIFPPTTAAFIEFIRQYIADVTDRKK